MFNFGLRPFKLREGCGLLHLTGINEAQCFINGYYSTSVFLMDKLKAYLLVYLDYTKHSQMSEAEKLLVGSVILEYLTPLLDDPFIFESQFVYSLFYELALINRRDMFDLVFKTLDAHCTPNQFKSFF